MRLIEQRDYPRDDALIDATQTVQEIICLGKGSVMQQEDRVFILSLNPK